MYYILYIPITFSITKTGKYFQITPDNQKPYFMEFDLINKIKN